MLIEQTHLKKNLIAMTNISHSQRYLPHDLNTKFYSVKLYRQGYTLYLLFVENIKSLNVPL